MNHDDDQDNNHDQSYAASYSDGDQSSVKSSSSSAVLDLISGSASPSNSSSSKTSQSSSASSKSSSISTETSDSDCSSSDSSFLHICFLVFKLSRWAEKYHHIQILCEHHVTMLCHEKQFDCKFCMSYESFLKLALTLSPFLEQNDKKSINCCGQPAISPAHTWSYHLLAFWIKVPQYLRWWKFLLTHLLSFTS